MWAPLDFGLWYILLTCLDTPLSQNELSGLRFLETLRRIRGNAQFFSNLLYNLIKPPNHFLRQHYVPFYQVAEMITLSLIPPQAPSRNKAITHVAITLPICQGVNIDSRKVIHACMAHHFYLRKKWNPIPSDSPGERNNMSCLPPFHFPVSAVQICQSDWNVSVWCSWRGQLNPLQVVLSFSKYKCALDVVPAGVLKAQDYCF